MVQANEHRIGNWVNFYHSISGETKPVQIWPEWFCNSADINDTSPIPLTPEILEKARFDKTCENEYRKGRLTFQFAQYQDVFIMSVFLDGSLMCILKYLHKLQNLYFALTGEELQIDL